MILTERYFSGCLHRLRRSGVMRRFHLFLALGLVAGLMQAQDWSRFRGPNGTGIAQDSGYPVVFGRGRNQLWRTPVRPGKSSPVLSDSHVFLTAAEEGRLYTQCFDRDTGQLVWERSIAQPRQELANKLNHEAAITPVTDGQAVYAFFKDFGLVAYSSEGAQLWESPLGPFTNLMGVGASPILVEDDVVVVVDQFTGSFVAAFARQTGEMRWKADRVEGESWSTPVLHEGRIATSGHGQFGLHDAVTGRRVGTHMPLAPASVASPALSADILYTFGYGLGNSGDSASASLKALERRDRDGDGRLTPDEYGDKPIENYLARNVGNRDGVVTADEYEVFMKSAQGINALVALRITQDGAEELWRQEGNFNFVIPSPLAYEDVIYVVRNGGILTTYDAASGAELKVARLTGALGGYSASPVAAEGRIWFGSEEGNVAVVRAGRDWEVAQVNELGEGIFATPALSGGVIYLRTEDALYALRNTE